MKKPDHIVPANQVDDRTYTYTWKGNCVPFGHGVHSNEEAAMEGAKRMVSSMPNPEDSDKGKEIILTVVR